MTTSLIEPGRESTSPLGIAGNDALTVREKLDLLNTLKAEATGLIRHEGGARFSLNEVEAAIAAVKLHAETGTQPEQEH